MGRLDETFIEGLKDRLPLSAVIGSAVAWDARKSNPGKGEFWAACPFHGEATPSFHVSDGKGFYHCFGCKASGDHFRWLMERQGLGFGEAVEAVARQAGVAMPDRSPDQRQRDLTRSRLFAANEAAAAFFAAQLAGERGREARAYLEGRGLGDAALQAGHGLGFAPHARQDLFRHLSGLKFSKAEIVAAGLAYESQGPIGARDVFINRIMFAIRDHRGRCAGFAGRALSPDEKAKYLNTGETPVFDKGRILWGLDRAMAEARHGNDLVIAEGYMDAIAYGRAGFAAACCMGTALTAEHLGLAWRAADEPCIAFDNDDAGIKAKARAVATALPLLEPGKSLMFLTLDGAKDADEFLSSQGADALKAAAAPDKRQSLVDALWAGLVASADVATPERQARFQAAVQGATAAIANPDVRRMYENALSDRLKEFWKTRGLKGATAKFGKAGGAAGGAAPPGRGGGGGGFDGLPEWGPEQCQRMNQRYAVVITGQRTSVLTDHDDELGDSIERVKFLNVDAFRLFLANRRARMGRRVDTLANLWLEDYHRRQYRGVHFHPLAPGEKPAASEFYNFWRGFVVEPKAAPELSAPWLDHVLSNICGGDQQLYEWLVTWFAWMVQRPRQRSGVAPVLRGGQGAGKTITGAIVGSLFPANYFLVDDARFLTGQFNAHLGSCLFLQADEAFWAGDKQAEGRLKGLITSDFQMIEYKGVDPVRQPNYVNLMISSNEDWVVPANARERRFAVIDVSAARLQDTDYFGKLAALYKRPDAQAALLHELLTWKIDEGLLRRIPGTEALFSQKVRSFDSFMGWLHEVLLQGALKPGEHWPAFEETRVLHDSFLKRAEILGHRHPLSADSFGRKLRSIVPGIERRQNAVRKWCYILPEMAECRRAFEAAVNFTIDWEQGGPGSLERRLDELGIGVAAAPQSYRNAGSGEEGEKW